MNEVAVHTFAIGDVHGRADLLGALLHSLEQRASVGGFAYRIVFLGDVIDRGPGSRQAMDLVLKTLRTCPGSKLILGNHEAMVLEALDEPDPEIQVGFWEDWISSCGGATTLRSYGLDLGRKLSLERLRKAITPEHVACFREAERYVELERHILVHAGIEPGIPLSEQDHHALMWIREPFLQHVASHGKIVVHGHTPTESDFAERYPNRIAIDVGAYRSDVLIAAHITPSGAVTVVEAVMNSLDEVTVRNGSFEERSSYPPKRNWTTKEIDEVNKKCLERLTRFTALKIFAFENGPNPAYFVRCSNRKILGAFSKLSRAREVLRSSEQDIGNEDPSDVDELVPEIALRIRYPFGVGDEYVISDAIEGFILVGIEGFSGKSTHALFRNDGEHAFICEVSDFASALVRVLELADARGSATPDLNR